MTHSIDREPTMQRRRMLRAGAMTLAGLATLSFSRGSSAARDGVLRILCSGPAGSIPDLVARAVGEQLSSATLGQRALIDNRPGAAGQISGSALKAAPADGSTLLLAQGAIATVFRFCTPSSATTLSWTCNRCRWRARCRWASRWARRCLRR